MRGPLRQKPIDGPVCKMLRVLICACVVPAVVSIIVTDYPPTSTEYNYSYNVVNPSTGDAKNLHEVRQGGIVRGSYSLIDPDGTRRTVKYTAGPRIGFKAVVHNEPANVQVPSDGYRPPPAFIGRLSPIHFHKLYPSATYLPTTKTNPVFFTPGNNVRPNKPALNDGEYFVANKGYHTNRI